MEDGGRRVEPELHGSLGLPTDPATRRRFGGLGASFDPAAGRRRWPDVVGGLLGGGYGVLSVVLGSPDAPHDRTPSLVLTVLAGLALGGVRRWPWPVLALEAGMLAVTDSVAPFATDTAQVGTTIALGFVAYRSGWWSTLGAFLVTFVATLVNIADPGNLQVLYGLPGAFRLFLLFGAAAAPVAFGRYLRGVRQAAAVAQERIREAEAMRVVETRAARLAERTALARDLHDILAHHVGAMALRAGSAHFAVRQTGRADDAIEALADVRATAVRVLDELRELLVVLRDPEAISTQPAQRDPEAISTQPAQRDPEAINLEPTQRDRGAIVTAPMLLAAQAIDAEVAAGRSGRAMHVEPEQMIDDAVRRVRAAGLRVAESVAEEVAGAPLVLRTTAARVVQEGVTNSLKHAGPGARVQVWVEVAGGVLSVLVADDGPPGMPPSLPPSGHGLAGLRERVALLGGTLIAGPAGAGWRLSARLPVREVT